MGGGSAACSDPLAVRVAASERQIVVVVRGGQVLIRWMSPREYARLQGADDFPLAPRVTQSLFGFGDAVCVPAIRWVDRHALTPLAEAALRERAA